MGQFNQYGVDMVDDTDFNEYRMTSSSPVYGKQLWLTNLTSVTVINAGETYELLCGTSIVSGNFVNGELLPSGTTRMRINKTGLYFISLTGCFEDVTNPAGTARLRLKKNDDFVGTVKSQYFPTQDKLEGMSVLHVESITAGDYITPWVTTENGDNLNICNGELVVFRVF